MHSGVLDSFHWHTSGRQIFYLFVNNKKNYEDIHWEGKDTHLFCLSIANGVLNFYCNTTVQTKCVSIVNRKHTEETVNYNNWMIMYTALLTN